MRRKPHWIRSPEHEYHILRWCWQGCGIYSMTEVWDKHIDKHNHIVGLVLFSRGYCPDWIIPVFEMNPSLRGL